MKTDEIHWVCHRCGTLAMSTHAKVYGHCSQSRIATFHPDTCDLCKRSNIPVTELRDYGYPNIKLINWKAIQEYDKGLEEAIYGEE